jgi:hypothetical protein
MSALRPLPLPALLALALLAPGAAFAQDAAGKAALDLSLPTDSPYAKSAPGTWYGDTSGKPASTTKAAQAATASVDGNDDEEACEGKLHGSVTMGMGYSRRGGNSNWQGANMHSCKTYYNDDGKPSTVGVSISVGHSDGPGFYGRGF